MDSERIKGVLRDVRYPGYERDIVSFGLVPKIEIEDGRVTVFLRLQGIEESVKGELIEAIKARLEKEGEVKDIQVLDAPQEPPVAARREAVQRLPLPGVDRVIAVASGKGGVGKSTVSVNLALSLARLGVATGLMDADIHGPNVPIMLGLTERLMVRDGKILPRRKWDLQAISIGLMLGEGAPLIWRGPMVAKAVQQLLRDVAWEGVDCLLVDLPPGTGDAQLTLVQQVPLSGGLIVTTPQDVALADVARGISMFRSVEVPVLGVIENMGSTTCPHCGERVELFGMEGGQRMAERLSVPFLGAIPFFPEIRRASDEGEPVVISAPESPAAQAFREVAERVWESLEGNARF